MRARAYHPEPDLRRLHLQNHPGVQPGITLLAVGDLCHHQTNSVFFIVGDRPHEPVALFSSETRAGLVNIRVVSQDPRQQNSILRKNMKISDQQKKN